MRIQSRILVPLLLAMLNDRIVHSRRVCVENRYNLLSERFPGSIHARGLCMITRRDPILSTTTNALGAALGTGGAVVFPSVLSTIGSQISLP